MFLHLAAKVMRVSIYLRISTSLSWSKASWIGFRKARSLLISSGSWYRDLSYSDITDDLKNLGWWLLN